jgi:tetraacyldisaccharide 4'-kinase
MAAECPPCGKLVDLAHDTARLVGDEPMLLAAEGDDRWSQATGSKAPNCWSAKAVDLIIMDDGFPKRVGWFSIRRCWWWMPVVVIGNGCVLPAGPVRAPVIDQVRHADAL